MRVFKNKAFTRFARKARISDGQLRAAVANIEVGLVDADLGGGIIKQRVARAGAGKSGGFRALIVIQTGKQAFFVHGFAKNERDNIREDELMALKRLAVELLSYDDVALAQALASGALIEEIGREQTIP